MYLQNLMAQIMCRKIKDTKQGRCSGNCKAHCFSAVRKEFRRCAHRVFRIKFLLCPQGGQAIECRTCALSFCMQWLDKIKRVKIALVAAALLIAVASLVVSHLLVVDMEREEYERMEIWAEAMRSLNRADETTDLALVLKVINGNNTIPVVVLDDAGRPAMSRNVQLSKHERRDSVESLRQLAMEWKSAGNSVGISAVDESEAAFAPQSHLDICYGRSSMLARLAVYPFVQLGVVLVFAVVAVFALMSSKRAEQNKVWVGLSKETAHQLGTPISSLMAWTEILKETYAESPLIPEMEKDVKRLQLIAERFSKIGSVPELETQNIVAALDRAVDYMSRRASAHVKVVKLYTRETINVSMNSALFEWVVENLSKNAMDAMGGRGTLSFRVDDVPGKVLIDVSDTGKGIPRKNFNSVFMPGYTTKKRGWGLGLSLARRIVEEYHHGRIYVLSSEVGKGTVFRIEMPKSK